MPCRQPHNLKVRNSTPQPKIANMEKTFDIKEELKKLPDAPGVYIMHDKDDVIIYIGKAKSLTKRVHQYFQASHNEGIKKKQMVEHIDHFEYIVTDSELEALVLECNLIKEHTPKYNTMLRDDKTYPYIKVTLGEDYPRVLFSRQMKKDKSRYFGPYTSASAVKSSIDLINKIYKLRTCNRRLPRDIGADRPCLNYHIHQCSAPCQGYVTKEEYAISVKGAIDFLNGDYEQTLKALSDKMLKASESMEFEKAAEYRDLINSVKQVAQKQKITNADGEDKDIIALANDDTDAVVQVFFIRNGKLTISPAGNQLRVLNCCAYKSTNRYCKPSHPIFKNQWKYKPKWYKQYYIFYKISVHLKCHAPIAPQHHIGDAGSASRLP